MIEMGELGILTWRAKNGDTDAVWALLEKFKPKIRRAIYQAELQEREDLCQELVINIIESIQRYDLNKTPGLWEFIGIVIPKSSPTGSKSKQS